jgi:ADP-ribosylglycohydrolase
VEVTLDGLRGWEAHEAIAAAVYIITRHPDDTVAGVLEAANTPGDSDSIATLVGALLGARHGIAALPHEWVTGVERSTELISLANTLTLWLKGHYHWQL